MTEGTYDLEFTKTGWETQTIEGVTVEGAETVNFVGNECVSFVGDVVTVAGTVLDCNGNPIAGALVEALDGAGILLASATTDADGDYTIGSLLLAAGDYFVTASADGFFDEFVRFTVAGTEADVAFQVNFPGFVDGDPANDFAQCLARVPGSIWPGLRVQLPALETVNCETWLQVQNVGDDFTKAILVIWGDPGSCEPQAAGPIKAECSGLIRSGSAWTWKGAQLPSGAKSAIVSTPSASGTPVVTSWRMSSASSLRRRSWAMTTTGGASTASSVWVAATPGRVGRIPSPTTGASPWR